MYDAPQHILNISLSDKVTKYSWDHYKNILYSKEQL